ncbi:hypothetical protein BS50DRAFT_591867 [Corynespora cassiicola Philippines]|uniref:Uncharacterized protein n=1 Tax=Corynespora cassiicola Philippines TaxID=1448308 RepID=A0A2T2NC20_CORCC|nr:hypothetical protein BS50DRAFT_591867 [Corynespora cassiicola Philippines]
MSDAGKPETGIRKALRKWKDLLKGDTTKKTPPMARGARPPPAPAPAATTAAAPPSSVAPSLSSPSSSRDGTTSPLPSHRPVPAPAALFAPTTQTIISSPADPRNRRRPHASPPSTLKKLPPNPRRNTAPADLFSHPNHSTATPVSIPMNTITTTITATQQQPHKGHARRSSRLRLSLSRRESGSKSPPPPLSSMMTSGSASGSASGRTSRTSSRATLHSADVAEQGMRWGKDAGTLIKTAEVVRRERRKGWAEDGWREQKREIVGAG